MKIVYFLIWLLIPKDPMNVEPDWKIQQEPSMEQCAKDADALAEQSGLLLEHGQIADFQGLCAKQTVDMDNKDPRGSL